MTDEEHKTDKTSTHPAIRTMSSDIDELLKTSRPTISQMITKETQSAMPSEHRIPAMPPRRPRMGPVVIIIGVLLIVGFIGGGVRYFLPTANPSVTSPGTTPGSPAVPVPPGTPQPTPVPVPPPQPLFSTDASRTITIPDNDRSVFLKLVTDTLQEPEQTGTVKRILIKLQPARAGREGQSEHYASIVEFFNLWHITAPQNFLQHLDPAFMFFVYYGSDGPRIGFATKTRDPARTLSDIFAWEQSLISDFAPFFFQEQTKPPDPSLFEDRTFSNTDWRYMKLSTQKDLGIGYLIFQANRLVIFTTSKTSMERIIKTLYGTQ
ncbi:MAG: hypothetical protein HY007_02620 [Candidatus Sungbacteria bacterium]|nr:hypothetical protein [Candidatus Sungbacteria bacterium]